MKKFEMAEILVEKFDVVDVITTSGYECPNELPGDGWE